MLDEADYTLDDLIRRKGQRLQYEYDFGDGWRRMLDAEATLPVEEGASYPRCLAGERACPLEDVGGPWGYTRFLEELSDRNVHPERYAELDEDYAFDPEAFSLHGVNDRLRRLGQRTS